MTAHTPYPDELARISFDGTPLPDLAAEVARLTAEHGQLRAEKMRLFRELVVERGRMQAVRDLFAGGPDTSCRTVWEDGIECVSVPKADLTAALDGPS